MSVTLMELQAILTANTTQFESAMGEAESKADSTAKDIAASFTRMGKTIDGAFQDAQGRWRAASGRFLSDGEKAAAGIESAFNKAGNGIQAAISKIGSNMKQLGSEMQAAGLAISAAVTAPIVALGAVVTKTGIDFQSSMNMLQAASGATGAQMEALRNKAVSLGADLSLPATSANDAGLALLELNKAGLSVNDTMNAATGTLRLAAAAGVDEARAAEIAATALNAFHLAGSEAGRVADLLAAAANASLGSINDMALAMQQSSASAAALKIPVQDLITSIGLMAQSGIKGSDAGTSLKTMFAALTPSTEKAAKAMKQLGIDAFDANGKFIGLENVIKQAAPALAKMTDEQKAFTIEAAFGSDAMRAANIVLGQGVQAFDAMSVAVNRSGAAQDLAGAKARGLGGAIDGLKSQLETIALAFSELVAGPLEAIVRNLAELAPKVALAAVAFAQANPQIVAFGVAVVGVTAIIGPLLLALGSIVAFIGGPFTIALVAAIGTISALVYAYVNDTGLMRTHTIGLIDELSATWKALGFTTSDAFLAMRIAIEAFVNVVVGPITALIGLVRFFADETKRAVTLMVAGFKVAQGDIAGAMASITEAVYSGAKNTVKASNDGIGGLSEGWGYRLNEVRSMLVAANSQYAALGAQGANSYVNAVRAGLKGLSVSAPPGGYGGFTPGRGGEFNLPVSGAKGFNAITQEQIKDQQTLANAAKNTGKAFEGAFAGAGKAAGGAKKEVNEVLNAVNDYLRKSKSSLTFSEAAWKGLTDAQRKYFVDLKNAYNQSEVATQTWAAKLTTAFSKVGGSLAVSIEDGKIRIRQATIDVISDVENVASQLGSIKIPNIFEFLDSQRFLEATQRTGLDLIRIQVETGDRIKVENAKYQADLLEQGAKNAKDLKDAAEKAYNDLADIVGDGLAGILVQVSKFGGASMTRMTGIAGGITDIIGGLPGKIGDKLRGATDAFTSWVNGIDRVLKGLHKIFADVPDGLGAMLSKIVSMIRGAQGQAAGGGGIGGAISGLASSAFGKFFGGGGAPAISTGASILSSMGWGAGAQAGVASAVGGAGAASAAGGASWLGALGGPWGIAAMAGAALLPKIIGLFKRKSAAEKEREQLQQQELRNQVQLSSQAVQKGAQEVVQSALQTFQTAKQTLEQIGDYTSIPKEAFQAFFRDLGKLMDYFVEMASRWKDDSLAKAKVLAEAMEPIVSAIGGGVEALTALYDYRGVAKDVMTIFFSDLQAAVELMGQLAEKIENGLQKRAMKFSDRIKSVVEVIGSGVEALSKLSTFTKAPADALKDFGAEIELAVQILASISDRIDLSMVKQAAKFAERASTVSALMKDGVEGFVLLSQFKSIPSDVIRGFFEAVSDASYLLAQASSLISDEMMDKASLFAEKAKGVFEIIGLGMTAFKDLVTFRAAPDEMVQALANQIQNIVSLIGGAVSKVDPQAQADAQQFAARMTGVFTFIQQAVDTIKSIADIQQFEASIWDNFLVYIGKMVDTFSQSISLMDRASQLAAMFKGLADAIKINVFAGIDSVKASAQALSALLAGGGASTASSITLESKGGSNPAFATAQRGSTGIATPITQYNTINIDPTKFKDVQEMLDWVSTMFGSAGQFPQAAHSS